MDNIVKIKPNKEVFQSLGVNKTVIEEVKVFTDTKCVNVLCSLDDISAFSEIEIIKDNIRKKFAEKFSFSFSYDIKEKKIKTQDLINLIKSVINDLKKRSALVNAYFSMYNVEVNENVIKFQLKHETAVEKIINSDIVKIIQKELENILKCCFEIEVEVGDFNKEIKKIDEDTIINLEKAVCKISDKNELIVSEKNSNKKDKDKDSNIVYGKKIGGKAISYSEFEELYPGDGVVLEGEVFNFDTRETRTGKILVMFGITDNSNSVEVKLFLKSGDLKINEGQRVKIRGKKVQDRFNNNEDAIMGNAINLLESIKKERFDNETQKRIELHAHTKMSEMDSVISAEDLVETAAKWGHKSIAITDHGVGYSFPAAYKASKKFDDFKVIFGIEGYLVDDLKKMVEKPKDLPIDDETYVVFDIETTGFDPHNNRIIEIGAVKLIGQKIVDRYNSLINPEITIPSKITELTGITNEMVKNERTIEVVLEEFYDFFGDSTLVAHNAPFDIGFIKQKSKLIDKEFENSVIDTLLWSRNIIKDISRHNLKAMCKYFNISLEKHHRAVDDAEATAKIFTKLLSTMHKKNVYKISEIDSAFETNIKKLRPFHISILAKNQKGLENLYRIISESHINYFQRVPRIPKSLLMKYREGLLIGSACEAGEVLQAFLKGRKNDEIEKVAEFYDYLEVMPTSNNIFMVDKGEIQDIDELRDINKKIYNLGKKLGKIVIATGDVHYKEPEDNLYRTILLCGKGFKDFDADSGLYFRTTSDMLKEFSYFGTDIAREIVITNPEIISEQIDKLQPVPDGFYPPKIEGAEEQVREMTYNKAKKIYGDNLPEILEKRIERELNAIINNGFAVLYLISQKLVKKSLDDGYLVGSRGSVGSSIVAYMMDITEVNALYPHYICNECKYSEFIEREGSGVDLPEKTCPKCGAELRRDGHSIPFEVFMGFNGDKVPDIDLNFSGEYQSNVHRYTEELFGRENVFRAGTISTLADKNAFGYAKKYAEEKGVDLRKIEISRLSKGCVNVRKTTGQHPGGMIVVPDDKSIYEFSPVQKPANDMKSDSITTHFDYHVMDEQLVKLDILGHDDPTTIKLLQEYTGVDIYSIPLADVDTLKIFSSPEILGVDEHDIGSSVGTFGIPEFGTKFVRNMLVETRPTKFSELVRISGLSHGTDVWINNAQDYIKKGDATLDEVISVRDDIMNYLIDNGIEKGTAFKIMEFVRKGKPTKDIEQWKIYEKILKEKNVKDWYIESCEKIKYMFPKGHAVAYVMMAMRIAYFKVHHPVAFYAAYLTRKALDINSDTMLMGIDKIKEERKGLEELPKLDVKQKTELTLLEILTEMNARKIELLGVDIYKSAGKRFLIEDGKLRPPLISINGLGISVVENIVAERDKGEFISFEDFMRRTKASKTLVEKIKEFKCVTDIPDFNQKELF